MSPDPLNPPLLTSGISGVGGQIRTQDADFEVEEIPAYDPSGSGEHLFLWIEKRGVGAEYFEGQIAKRLNISRRDVGTAGLKDRHAVTRQWVSVPQSCESLLNQLDGDGIQLLRTARHSNKLKLGHLRGNRFNILIRGAEPSRGAEFEQIVQQIREKGLPNYYGEQRFGRDNETADLGMALLKGESTQKVRNPFLKKLALSAAQSILFNYTLALRIQAGLFRKVLPGEVMLKWPFGGMFTVENVEAEQARFELREIVPGGPIFGRKMFPVRDEALALEERVLNDFQLRREQFSSHGDLLSGTRRYNLIYLDDLQSEWTPDGLRLRFSLPSGSYATVLLREVMKGPMTVDNG
jgi:tRNA pseudouridine13 synthase